MKLYFSIKLIKGNKKSKFSKKQQILHKQTIEIKQVKQMATLKYSYSSSQTAEFHPLLWVSRDHSTLQLPTRRTIELFRSVVRLVGNFFERMQSWRAIPSFDFLSFAMKRTQDMSLF